VAPRNVILFIGDGMGPEQVRAGAHAGILAAAPYKGAIRTRSASSSVTDSAAAATALATGHKVNNGVVSMALPGDGQALPTILEIFAASGRGTGLVTTTEMTHATPAAFGSHVADRGDGVGVADDYLEVTRPDVLLGGGVLALTDDALHRAGYEVARTRDDLAALAVPRAEPKLAGLFGVGHLPYEADGPHESPRLSELTAAALARLSAHESGFFLMVEGGRIDHAGHANEIARLVGEVVEFERAVGVAVEWAKQRDDTTILVTADHETGGLSLTSEPGQGLVPGAAWSTGGHTAVDVPLFVWGSRGAAFAAVVDNTGFFHLLTK
jgi:alkaline phosphatase